jgi:hypothetical protein
MGGGQTNQHLLMRIAALGRAKLQEELRLLVFIEALTRFVLSGHITTCFTKDKEVRDVWYCSNISHSGW